MDFVIQLLIWAFALSLMLSVGLDLPWRRLDVVRRSPGPFAAGMLLNFAFVPLVALGLIHALELSPIAAPGLLTFAAAAGGPMGCFLTQQAKGDLGLAVAIVVAVNLLNPIVVPLWMQTLGGAGALDLMGLVKTILLLQLAPLIVGLAFRDRLPDAAIRWQPRVARLASLLLVVAIIGMVITKGSVLLEVELRALLAVAICVIASLLGGILLGLGRPGTVAALALTGGIRNGSLAFVLVTAWFPEPATLLVAMSYSVVMFPLTLGVSLWLRRLNGEPAVELG